jgi:hypothetical protein
VRLEVIIMVIMKICLVGCHAVYFGKFVPTAVFAAPQNIRRRIALGSDILIIRLISETTNTEI